MRLLSGAIAQKIFLDSFPQLEPTVELARELSQHRDELVKRTDKVIVFLFSTLVVISFVLFDVVESAKFLGIELSRPDVFIFSAFMVGNLLYVSSTGLFLKVFIIEFLILYVVTDKDFKGSKITSGFLYSYPANVLAFLNFNDTLKNATSLARLIFSVSRIYTRYALLVLYSVFYFSVLGVFLLDLWTQRLDSQISQVFFWVLTIANALSVVTSFAIFLPARAGATAARGRRLAEREKLRAQADES